MRANVTRKERWRRALASVPFYAAAAFLPDLFTPHGSFVRLEVQIGLLVVAGVLMDVLGVIPGELHRRLHRSR